MSNISKQALKSLPYTAVIASPIGILGIKTDHQFVYGIDFLPTDHRLLIAQNALAQQTEQQLKAYFDADFDKAHFIFDLPLALNQGSEFQQKVWQALLKIPAGHIKQYGVLAKDINSHARAIGTACRTNLFPIIIPCHRVLDRNNRLRGYKGSNSSKELHIKEWLLTHEKFKIPNR